jgi:hypothetical protein
MQSKIYVQINLALDGTTIKRVLIKVHGEDRDVYLDVFDNFVRLFLRLALSFCPREFPIQILLCAVVYLYLHKFSCLRRIAPFQCDVEVLNRTPINVCYSNRGRRLIHIIKTAFFTFF